jgi:hypothetical protein
MVPMLTPQAPEHGQVRRPDLKRKLVVVGDGGGSGLDFGGEAHH